MVIADFKCLEKLVRYNNKYDIAWKNAAAVSGSEVSAVLYCSFYNNPTQKHCDNLSVGESVLLPKGNFFRIKDKMTGKQRLYQKGMFSKNRGHNISEKFNPIIM